MVYIFESLVYIMMFPGQVIHYNGSGSKRKDGKVSLVLRGSRNRPEMTKIDQRIKGEGSKREIPKMI